MITSAIYKTSCARGYDLVLSENERRARIKGFHTSSKNPARGARAQTYDARSYGFDELHHMRVNVINLD